MTHRRIARRVVCGLAIAASWAPVAGAQSDGTPPVQPVGEITISQTQVSLLGSVSWGSGTLRFEGRTHRFRIRGLGLGGVGYSEIRAAGEVYGLSRLTDFPGLYGAMRTGAVAGSAAIRGGIWLQNPAGVSIHLRPRRTGVALQIGADGLLIEME